MPNEDIIFRATLEYREVIRSLEAIGISAEQAAVSADRSLAALGQSAERLAGTYEAQFNQLHNIITLTQDQGDVTSDVHKENIAKRQQLIRKIEQTKKLLAEEIALSAKQKGAPPTPITTPAGSISLGPRFGEGLQAPRFAISEMIDMGSAQADFDRLGKIIEEMFERGELKAKQFAGLFHTIGNQLANELSGEDLSKALKPLEAQARNILNMFKAGDFDIADDANIDTMTSQMTELRAVASEFLQSSSDEAQKFGATLLAKLDQAEDAFINSGRKSDVLRKNMKAITAEVKQTVGASTELEEQMGAIGKLPLDLQKKFKTKLVEVEVKRLENVIKQLGKSTSTEANKAGKEFEEMGQEIKEAYDKGDVGAEETVKGLRDITTGANKAGNAFDENFGKLRRGATQAGPPIWKLGTAMDRVGIRGAGGMLRVVDAVKEMGPAFIAAAVAAAGLAVVVTKLIGLAVEMGKKFAAAFFEFTKGSVDAAKQIQHLDAQFAGLLQDASGKLGKTLRDFVIEQSFEFGVDLTGDFANILVPLAESTDQIAQMAEDVAAISHFRGIAVENIVNAVKQATGGHFRPFQQTLGMTPQERDRVIELQEAYGQLTGTLMGLEEFMERRGIDFEALGDSLAVAQGKLTVFIKQMKIALGEPVRDTLGEEFHDLLTIIENDTGQILRFINSIGQAVSSVISNIGNLGEAYLESIDHSDILEIEGAIDDLALSVNGFIDAVGDVTDEDIESLKDAIIGLSGAIEDLVGFGTDAVYMFDDIAVAATAISDAINVVRVSLDLFKQAVLGLIVVPKGLFDFGKDIAAGFEADSDRPGYRAIQEAIQDRFGDESLKQRTAMAYVFEGLFGINVGRLWDIDFEGIYEEANRTGQTARDKAAEGFAEGLGEGAFLDETRFIGWKPPRVDPDALDEISRRLQIGVNERQISDIEKEIAELEEKLGTVKIGIEFDQREAKIFVDEADKLLKLEEDFSIKRRDATNKYLNQLREARIKWNIDNAKIMQSFNDKELDIFQKYRDKEDDIEEDRAKKRIKIEEKLQEKLRDIRAKFDFDAAEAIRMNDAVALLRIRRRMAFELAQAKLKNKEDIEKNEETAEEKQKDNKKWLDRQIRDNEIAEERKIRDAEQSWEDRKRQLDRQYDDELKVLALHEEDKRKELGVWLENALRDLDTWHSNKLEMMAEQNKDEIAQLREHERLKRQLMLENMHLMSNIIYDPVAWGESSTNLYSPSEGPGTRVGPDLSNYYNQPSPSPMPLPNVPGATPAPAPAQNVGPSQEVLDARNLAVSLADKGGFHELAEMMEKSTNLAAINTTIAWLRQQGLAKGGIAQANRTAIVGEKRQEAIAPVSAGIVAPHVPFIVQPGGGGGGQIINDNSSNVSADLSMLDPSQVSPMQRTIIRSIIADEILNYGVA